jgi:hypothetical protein
MTGAGLGYLSGGKAGKELGTEYDIKKNASAAKKFKRGVEVLKGTRGKKAVEKHVDWRNQAMDSHFDARHADDIKRGDYGTMTVTKGTQKPYRITGESGPGLRASEKRHRKASDKAWAIAQKEQAKTQKARGMAAGGAAAVGAAGVAGAATHAATRKKTAEAEETKKKPTSKVGVMARSLGGMAVGTGAGYLSAKGLEALANRMGAKRPMGRWWPAAAAGAGAGLGAIYPYMKAKEMKELQDDGERK